MGKFGLGKKDGDDDEKRFALFGSRSKNKSPAPPTQNPYAQPYIPPDPYTQAKINAGILPPPQQPSAPGPTGPPSNGYGNVNTQQGGYGGMGQPPRSFEQASNDRYGAAPTGYAGQGYGGHQDGAQNGASRYGTQSGYGMERANANPYSTVSQPSARAGGYGGLGRTYSDETTTTEANRDALFGDASKRYEEQQQQQPYGYNPEQKDYGTYGDRQLTAEEEEEEDVQASKNEIKFIKQQDVASTRNALQIANQAVETGSNTLARLGAQGERIHNTERNLDLAANHNLDAEAKARELKTLNRSMWAVHVGNPFTAKERLEKQDAAIMKKHRDERDQREASREQAFKSTQRMQDNFAELGRQPPQQKSQARLAERSKYQFEADSEDDEMENEIDTNLDALSGAAKQLNLLARATGDEVDAQNKHLARIADKVRTFSS